MMPIQWTLAAALLLFSATAWSHGDANDSRKPKAADTAKETAFGKAGDPKRTTRTVHIAMNDNMRFAPDALTVERGETIRFVVRNEGKIMHEMVLGTPQTLKAHAEMMRKSRGMKHAEMMRKPHGMTHDEAYMVHVAPGKTGEIVWEFTQTGSIQFGCLIPGHFEAGMIGKVEIER